jgi:hypothetical protein
VLERTIVPRQVRRQPAGVVMHPRDQRGREKNSLSNRLVETPARCSAGPG